MQFVHKFHDYLHVIHVGVSHNMPGAGGAYVPVQSAPHLGALFQKRNLPITRDYGDVTADTAAIVWRELARQFFDGKDSSRFAHEPPGAYRHDGVTTATDGEGDNVFFSGSQREWFYGVFDTDDVSDCEPMYKAAFEAVLSGDADACKRVSEEMGYVGTSALRPTTDLRAGEMVIMDKLLSGGYGEFVVQTPEGPFITGMGLAETRHVPKAAPVPVEAQAAPGWPVNFPWPSYNEMSGNHLKVAKEIAETVILIGLEPSKVLAYELEHKNRKGVIERLTKLVNDAGAAPADTAEETPAQETEVANELIGMAATVS